MFGGELKRWRQTRRLSQEDLAGVAGISARHVSCLERGVSWPSEAMVLKLGRALDLPLRERNSFLGAAGFAQRWHDSGDEVPVELRPILDRLLSTLTVPAYALSGSFTIYQANPLGWIILRMLKPDAAPGMNLAKVFLGGGPHRELIIDYPATAQALLARLRTEASAHGPGSSLWPIIHAAENDPALGIDAPQTPVSADPVLPLSVDVMGTTTKWLTILMSFGTPQDAMVEQLTIEQLLPADDATEALVRQLGTASWTV